MFKLIINRLPWRGEEVKRRLVAEHKAGIKALAYDMAELSRTLCPYDHSKPANELHLRDTIQVISEADGKRHHVIASAPWAEPVHNGHVMRNGQFYPPNPFMTRALRWASQNLPQYLGKTRVQPGYHRGALMGATFE